LEGQGFITRQPDPADGRYTNAVLTEAGTAAVVASAPGHVTAVRSLVFDALTGDQAEALRDAGERILAKVDPGGRPLGL
jgi:DNA-binding MarR family transcriptional regulator